MSYATAAEMDSLLGTADYLLVADRDGDGSADTAAVDQALADASSVADTYVTRFLPLTLPVPTALRDAVIHIAAYTLAGVRATEHHRKRYEDALRWLRDVADGKASLGVNEPARSVGSPKVKAPERLFTRESLSGVL